MATIDSVIRAPLEHGTQVHDLDLWREVHTCENCHVFDKNVEWYEWEEQLLCPPCHAKAMQERVRIEKQRVQSRADEVGCSYALMLYIETLEHRITYLDRRIATLENR